MTATCTICGATVTAHRGPMLLNPGTDPAAAAAVAEISEFDLLAGRMSQHLELHRDQSQEMGAVMHLAAKVYAMTWAESPTSEPEYSALREAWRTGILTMMQGTSKPVATYDAAAALTLPLPTGAGGGGSSSAPPVGSNEKKSVRNDSN